jgi:hypothetical protein
MPAHTKDAMLRGIRSNRVIVGAYVDKRGGVCPMLAAHRNGGRTNFGTFARAWDAFTGANQRKPRRASRREVRALEGYLEMALLREGVSGGELLLERPLAEEVHDVQATRRRLAAAEAHEAFDLSVEDVLATASAEHALARAWAADLLQEDQRPAGSRPTRMLAALERQRLQRFAQGAPLLQAVPRWASLWATWRAARD